jgi:hypothetical protein
MLVIGLIAEAGPSRHHETAAIDIIPLAKVGGDSPLRVAVLVKNTSDAVVRYLPAGDGRSFNRLQFILQRDGVVIPPIMTPGHVARTEERVRELRPGAMLEHSMSLRDMFGPLEPGRYSVSVSISEGGGDFGITPIHFDRQVMFIDVQGPAKQDNEANRSKR